MTNLKGWIGCHHGCTQAKLRTYAFNSLAQFYKKSRVARPSSRVTGKRHAYEQTCVPLETKKK